MRKVYALAAICCFIGIVQSSCTNNKPSVVAPSCDTTTVRLSVEINQILTNNCFGCHGSSPSSGINLQDYNTIKGYAASGVLLSAITHTGNVSPMPMGGSMLSDCQIDYFRAWINRGMLDN